VHAVGRRPESLVTLHLTSSPPDNAELLGEHGNGRLGIGSGETEGADDPVRARDGDG
jgi:hypothetical protein